MELLGVLTDGSPQQSPFPKDCPQLQEDSLPKVTSILNYQALGGLKK